MTVTNAPILFEDGAKKGRLRIYNRSTTDILWMRELDESRDFAEQLLEVTAGKGTPIDPMSGFIVPPSNDEDYTAPIALVSGGADILVTYTCN